MNLSMSVLSDVANCSDVSDVEYCAVAWEKIAEPQPDDYDTTTCLAWGLKKSKRTSDMLRYGACLGGRLDLVDCKYPGSRRAPSDHPNFNIAWEALQLWPAAERQFFAFTDSVEATLSQVEVGGYVGTRCGSGDDLFTFSSTVDTPLGFAEAMVHELAHRKLRAIGVTFEDCGMFFNVTRDMLYYSPIRYDAMRPLGAVLHAQYSYTYIMELMCRVALGSPSRELVDAAVRSRVATILPKLAFGASVLQEVDEVNSDGGSFMSGYWQWWARLRACAERLLTECKVAVEAFRHPLIDKKRQ